MKVIFLGTGTSQGVPVINCSCDVCQSLDFRDQRLRTSVYIETNHAKLIIDTGPDFRQQMLNHRIKDIDAVLFTHEHKDHTAGLDDIRSYNYSLNKEIPLYGPLRVLEQIQREFAYIFSEKKYPGIPKVALQPIEKNTFKIKKETILPIEVMHYRLPIFGYKIQNFVYITDAKTISKEEKIKMKHCKILVLNALQKTPHISHFTLQEALDIIQEIQPQQAYLTHIGHKMGKHAHVSKALPENVKIAYDGLTLTF